MCDGCSSGGVECGSMNFDFVQRNVEREDVLKLKHIEDVV